AVLHAADARSAVRVAHREEGRLSVETLHGQKWTHRAAPAALAFQEHAAGERRGEADDDEEAKRGAVFVKDDPARRNDHEEQRDADDIAVLAEPLWHRERSREAEESWRLVERGHRAHVAPQTGREEEEERQRWNDDAPEEEQAERRIDEQRHDDGGRDEQSHDARSRPDPRRHA